MAQDNTRRPPESVEAFRERGGEVRRLPTREVTPAPMTHPRYGNPLDLTSAGTVGGYHVTRKRGC